MAASQNEALKFTADITIQAATERYEKISADHTSRQRGTSTTTPVNDGFISRFDMAIRMA
jgi:hypothetical protein